MADEKEVKTAGERYEEANKVYRMGYVDGVENCYEAIKNIVEDFKDKNADTVLSLIVQGLGKYVKIQRLDIETTYGNKKEESNGK